MWVNEYEDSVCHSRIGVLIGISDILTCLLFFLFFFFQAEDGIRDLVRSRGLGDVYKRQPLEARTKPPGWRI